MIRDGSSNRNLNKTKATLRVLESSNWQLQPKAAQKILRDEYGKEVSTNFISNLKSKHKPKDTSAGAPAQLNKSVVRDGSSDQVGDIVSMRLEAMTALQPVLTKWNQRGVSNDKAARVLIDFVQHLFEGA